MTLMAYQTLFDIFKVHRLDKDSSGILVMGRTQTSATFLHSLFREKTVGALNNVRSIEYPFCLFFQLVSR